MGFPVDVSHSGLPNARQYPQLGTTRFLGIWRNNGLERISALGYDNTASAKETRRTKVIEYYSGKTMTATKERLAPTVVLTLNVTVRCLLGCATGDILWILAGALFLLTFST